MAGRSADQRPVRPSEPGASIEDNVRRALAPDTGVLLAVSGGRDSMVLLHAAVRVAPERVVGVATFDHGTGPHATAAAALVERIAREAGLRVVRARAGSDGRSEAAWRAARWAFLREAAAAVGGVPVATAHTQDDQAETVFMRVLRGAGARGLAGLAAGRPDVLRPLLAVPRAEVAAYAAAHRVAFLDDPSNLSRRFLRNRVRLDLLPAIERVSPGFRSELLDLGERAAAWRAGVDAFAAELSDVSEVAGGRELSVPAAALEGLAGEELAVLWPALAARVGVTLDRRGTVRLSWFTSNGLSGGVAPLSGGAFVRRERERFVLRDRSVNIAGSERAASDGQPRPLRDGLRFGRFRFRCVDPSAHPLDVGAWTAELDQAAALTVRPWKAGDRMHVRAGGPARRVKRFFGDARISALDRQGWPVVLADGVIVWIPGVRRSDAATVRPGRPGLRYECDGNG